MLLSRRALSYYYNVCHRNRGDDANARGAIMYRLFAALLLFATATASASAQSPPIPSFWKNQRGSEMSINIANPAPGSFGGFFWNHAQNFQCQASPTNPKPYTVVGQTHRSYVTFTVVWDNEIQNCHSTTVWRGHVNGQTLITVWRLTGPGIPPITGTDIFQRMP